MPRSLFLTNDFPPRIGGAQSHYWGLIRTLDPADVVVLAPGHRDAAAFDARHPYRVVRARESILLPSPSLLHRAEELIRGERLDLVQLGHPLPVGLLGPLLTRRTGRPYLVFLGGAEVTLPAALPGVGSALRHVLRRASLLVAVSSFTAAEAHRQAGGETPVAVLRPAIDPGGFLPRDRVGVEATRRDLGVRGPLVVCVGRLVPRKGQDVLIDALALLTDAYPTVELALIGDGRLHGALHRRARRRGVADRVRLLGALPAQEVRRWLRAADVFASPCRSRWGGREVEGFGLVFAEAALAGLPVLAGRSGGAPEAVSPGDGGIVVEGGRADEVAAGLGRLLSLTETARRRMGERGRRLSLGRHAPAVVGPRYRELLIQAAQG
ncbi:MAG: GDP-mannose-dependent alpha-(1-6)-phosphatidylinositol monomannoside mannosyltransferase [Thermoleophilia bacterium]